MFQGAKCFNTPILYTIGGHLVCGILSYSIRKSICDLPLNNNKHFLVNQIESNVSMHHYSTVCSLPNESPCIRNLQSNSKSTQIWPEPFVLLSSLYM